MQKVVLLRRGSDNPTDQRCWIEHWGDARHLGENRRSTECYQTPARAKNFLRRGLSWRAPTPEDHERYPGVGDILELAEYG